MEFPDEIHVQAPVQDVPSTKMYWLVAPAARTPSMQAWFRDATMASDGSSWNSLLQSKITLVLFACDNYLAYSCATPRSNTYKWRCDSFPISFEIGGGSNNVPVVASVIMGIDDGKSASIGDVLNYVFERSKVR